MVLGSNRPLTEMSIRENPRGKGSWCVGLTASPPSYADCHGIWKPQPPGTLTACSGLYRNCFPFKGWDSSVGKATRYGIGRSGEPSPVEARFSAPVQTGPGAYPVSYTTGNGFFPGVKRLERGVDHPPTSSVEVQEKAEL